MCGRDDAYRSAGDRFEDGERRLEAQLALEQKIHLAESQGSDQERLVDATEPGQGGAVIQ